MHTPEQLPTNDESRALAACYRLLLQKAAERQAQLAITENKNEDDLETAVSPSNNTTD